ncbi:ArfGap-domain-containing protein [Macrolepiota fuliginosa MF-IS2]|uniref:ArfGap-domain-containing protein n=1 Tax=Macrolepiota fuliginosa MF-IS2 TaxID=1400762 RepID=A0A9P6C1A5_9AGAR|nr:ArfGap-domain-containing protein [Macrolepiota fuliginosa MF-IS2]
MADPTARKLLNELIKREGLNNKVCIDCNNPNPQWASLSFAVFLCLQCAGTHRGFGVHISFVRSVTMDAWQEDQLRRMGLGGNAPFREFMKSYDPSGGYKVGANPYDTYHCWAATQYREKLGALLAGKDWSPSPAPANQNTISRSASPNPSAAQGLRKSRAQNARSNTGRSESPSSFTSASPQPASSSNLSNSGTLDQKSQNESYFASLGKLNETRSADLPPSQGGRYQGFGNTPTPPPGGSHPSFGLSSANAPTLSDLQENPMAALSKGWSLFSAAVAGATKVVSENVIQPGMEKISDPTFQASVKGYVGEAQKRAVEAGGAANTWSKQSLGIDVADTVYGVKERVLGGPARSGYGHVASYGPGDEDQSSALYDGHDEDDFFGEFNQAGSGNQTAAWAGSNASADPAPAAPAPGVTRRTTGSVTSRAKAAKKDEDWDEWKDF